MTHNSGGPKSNDYHAKFIKALADGFADAPLK
jgi:hypothetical protein